MGNIGTITPLGSGSAIQPTRTVAKSGVLEFPHSFPMNASYATGGDTYVEHPGVRKGRKLRQLIVHSATDMTRRFKWNGSATAPKVFAIVEATGAEVAATTNLSGVTVYAVAIYES